MPHPYDCHKYVVCGSWTPVEKACSEGLVFNPDIGVCTHLTDTACAQPIVTGMLHVRACDTHAVIYYKYFLVSGWLISIAFQIE